MVPTSIPQAPPRSVASPPPTAITDYCKRLLQHKELDSRLRAVSIMVACLFVAIPTWNRNGYQFWVPQSHCSGPAGNHQIRGTKEGVVLVFCTTLFTGSVLALGAIVSAKPLDDLGYKGWTGEQKSFTSPYASPVYIGWAMASAIALAITGVLSIVSWFTSYRFSLFSAVCVGIFTVVLVSFCGASYIEVVKSRDDQVPTKGDFLAALLPLICIPAFLSLCSRLYKWKDENWKFSRGVYIFVTIGLLLLLGAISYVIVVVTPWTIGVSFLLESDPKVQTINSPPPPAPAQASVPSQPSSSSASSQPAALLIQSSGGENELDCG